MLSYLPFYVDYYKFTLLTNVKQYLFMSLLYALNYRISVSDKHTDGFNSIIFLLFLTQWLKVFSFP